jgi:hypothetical protein
MPLKCLYADHQPVLSQISPLRLADCIQRGLRQIIRQRLQRLVCETRRFADNSALRMEPIVDIVHGLPYGVELCRRERERQTPESDEAIWIVINHGENAQTVRFKKPVMSLFDGTLVESLNLTPLAVPVLSEGRTKRTEAKGRILDVAAGAGTQYSRFS